MESKKDSSKENKGVINKLLGVLPLIVIIGVSMWFAVLRDNPQQYSELVINENGDTATVREFIRDLERELNRQNRGRDVSITIRETTE